MAPRYEQQTVIFYETGTDKFYTGTSIDSKECWLRLITWLNVEDVLEYLEARDPWLLEYFTKYFSCEDYECFVNEIADSVTDRASEVATRIISDHIRRRLDS